MSTATVRDVVRSNDVPAKHATKLSEMLNVIANQHPNDRIIPGTKSARYIPNAGGFNPSEKIPYWIDPSGKSPSIVVPSAPVEPAQALPKCMIANYTPGDISEQGDMSWAGSVLGAYPITIAKNEVGGFRHRYVDGSEGALLYHGNNEDTDITYVFAWKDTRGDNKVYVEGGPSEDYETPPWDIIRNKLHIYGGKKSYFKDNGTGAEASAQIGVGMDFTAAAVFDVTTI